MVVGRSCANADLKRCLSGSTGCQTAEARHATALATAATAKPVPAAEEADLVDNHKANHTLETW